MRTLRFDPLDTGQIDTLDQLWHHGPCTMVTLSAAMRVEPSTATRAVDRLVRAGLAFRNRSDTDGRVVLVDMTPEGRELHVEISRKRLQQMDGILTDFSASDLEQLAHWLEELVEATDRYHAREDTGEQADISPGG